MTRIQLARRAVHLYSAPWAPLSTNKYNRRSWLRSVDLLGDKWLYRHTVPLTVLEKQVRR